MPKARLAQLLLALALCGGCTEESMMVRHHTQDGFHLYDRGAYADAADCFQAALHLKPGDPDLTYHLALCHERTGQRAKAEALYKEAIDRDADHPMARHAWLLLMIDAGREAEGRQMVKAWLRERPDKAGPYVEDAWLYARDGDLDSARLRYQQAVTFEPANDRALVGLGGIFEKIGRPGRALALYERALEVRPNQPEVKERVESLRKQGVTGPKPD
jgi:tetratricopeptide (TPR) repeat protein